MKYGAPTTRVPSRSSRWKSAKSRNRDVACRRPPAPIVSRSLSMSCATRLAARPVMPAVVPAKVQAAGTVSRPSGARVNIVLVVSNRWRGSRR